MSAESKADERAIRRNALEYAIPTMTTLAAARAAVLGIRAMGSDTPAVLSVQEYHGTASAPSV